MAMNPMLERYLKELREQKAKIELAGGADKIEKQHQAGSSPPESGSSNCSIPGLSWKRICLFTNVANISG